MPIGIARPSLDIKKLALKAHEASSRLPELLVAAHHIANTVTLGWHGRKKRGSGEDFWQFRPYVAGESTFAIDWRRSARDEHTYIRDREWEAAQTIALLPDRSPSMQFQSRYAERSKAEHALLLTLALCDVFSRSGERIALPGILAPVAAKDGAERAAIALMHDKAEIHEWAENFAALPSFSRLIILSDFLNEPESIFKKLAPLAQKNITLHLIEIADPAEEMFPYSGRVEFIDPTTRAVYLAGHAESLKDDYRKLYFARREILYNEATRRGWSFMTSKTDEPPVKTILQLSTLLMNTERAGGDNL